MNTQVGFIGGGNMAACIIGGLSKSAPDGTLIELERIWIYDRNPEKMKALQALWNVQCASNSEHLIEQSEVVVLAVKPQALKALLAPLAAPFNAKRPLIISVAAGIPSTTIERWLGADFAVVRAMPNTPALIGLGACGLYANARVSEEQKDLTSNLLNSIGTSLWLDEERLIDLVTALSGSGPAYFMLFIQSLIDASVAAGLDPQSAKTLTLQTAIGAAELIKHSDLSITQLINNISSPNGTTEHALTSLHRAKLPSIVADAFSAAKHRAEQMAIEMDN